MYCRFSNAYWRRLSRDYPQQLACVAQRAVRSVVAEGHDSVRTKDHVIGEADEHKQ